MDLNRGLHGDGRRREHCERGQRAAGHRSARVADHDRKQASGRLDIGQHERGLGAEREVREAGDVGVRAPLITQRLRAGGGNGKPGGRPREIGLALGLIGDDRLRPSAVDKAEHEAGPKKLRFRFHSSVSVQFLCPFTSFLRRSPEKVTGKVEEFFGTRLSENG